MSAMETDADLLRPAKEVEKPFRIPMKKPSENDAETSGLKRAPKENQTPAKHPWAKKQGEKRKPFRRNWIEAPKKGASTKLKFASDQARQFAVRVHEMKGNYVSTSL